MAYITQDELEALFPDTFTSVTDELWSQVLPGVDALIDGVLSSRYLVPFSPVPALIKEIATDIARYHLEDSLIYDEVKDEGLKTRYDYALERLQLIKTGDIKLAGAQSLAGVSSIGGPQYVAGARVFTTDYLSNF